MPYLCGLWRFANAYFKEKGRGFVLVKRIFLLEDDLSLLNGLSFAIKKQGYELDVARTTLEAEEMWNQDRYNLAILDVSLPMRCMIWERKGLAALSGSMCRRMIKESAQASGLMSMALHAVRREKKQHSVHMHLCGITDCG